MFANQSPLLGRRSVKKMNIEQAEIELGLSFKGEGNLYVTKSKLGANLTVKLVLTPKD
jgi:hypothetical protein